MKLIAEIDNKDIGLECKSGTTYKVRKTVRGVILNDSHEVGITYSPVTKLYKLPGGGIELDEDHKSALKREIREETGYDSEINMSDPIGITIEYKEDEGQISISYVYEAKIIGDPKDLAMTNDEIVRKTTFKWMRAESIIDELKNTTFNEYPQKFIALREVKILEEVLSR